MSNLEADFHAAILWLIRGEVEPAVSTFYRLRKNLQFTDTKNEKCIELRKSISEVFNLIDTRFLLSKTSYVKGCQCRKLLHLYKHSKALRDPVPEEVVQLFKEGHSFEDDVRLKMFNGGFDVEGVLKSNRKYYPLLTSLIVQQPHVNALFEATFIAHSTLVMIDVLSRTETGWEIFEIKNSNKKKDTFIVDAAVQFYIASKCIGNIQQVSLILNDSGPRVIDITEDVISRQEQISKNLEAFLEVLNLSSAPDVMIGDHCLTPYRCDFHSYCHH